VSPLYKVKDTANNLTFQQPHTYNHLPESLQQSVAEWLRKQKE
jgi:hypothetical protein